MAALHGLNVVPAWLSLRPKDRQACQKDDRMTESAENRLRRLRIRSWRRGMKEMDLILGHFADGPLALLDGADLDAYEAMLNENDQDLYLWVTARVNGGTNRGPDDLGIVLDQIADHAAERLRPVR
jgi:antitoxin CptB